MRDASADDPENCGCAPSDAERRALWPGRVTRRSALALGIAGLAAAAVATTGRMPAAYADEYPSWADVQAAKASESAKNAEIARINTLIQNLQTAAAQAQQLAQQRGDEFYNAQQAFFDADARAQELQAQADKAASRAKDAADKAGRVAAQLYQSGGDDASLQLFLSGSAAKADDLLSRLNVLDTVLGANRTVYQEAIAARDSAQSLTDQAEKQRRERDRLQKIAQQKMADAQAASDAADAAVANQNNHLMDLQAQLAALRDATAKTVAGYEAGVEARRKAEAERQRRLAAQRAAEQAAALRAQQEAQRRAQQQQQQHSSGGGSRPSGGGGGSRPSGSGSSGGGGTSSNGSGWVRPVGGGQSSGYGWRMLCINGGCHQDFHPGVDLAPGCNAPIHAAHSGRVVYAGYNGGYGNYVRILNNDGTGYGTGYGHIVNGGILVRSGQWVQTGQVIAYVGSTGYSTGCHLHFEVYVNGSVTNPISFMAARGISV